MSAELDAPQRAALVALVGEEVARQDEPAVATAYADFRAGMEGLRAAFAERVGSRESE